MRSSNLQWRMHQEFSKSSGPWNRMALASFKESEPCMEDIDEDLDSIASESELSESNRSDLGIDQNIGRQSRVSRNSKETELMDSRLIYVAIKGDVDGLKLLLQERDPNILQQLMTPFGDSLLHLAAKFGHQKLLLEICGRSPSLVTKKNRSGNMALHVGARAGHLALVRQLIDKMTSSVEYGTTTAIYLLGSKNHKGDTALHEALRYCRRDVAKLLIQMDPNLCHLVNKAGESPLFLAVIKGYNDVVDEIFHSSLSPAWGVPKEWTDVKQVFHSKLSPAFGGPRGWTALHASTMINNAHVRSYVTEKLLQAKPELARVQNNDGETPLHFAVRMKLGRIAKLLLQQDASLAYIQDRNGWTALHAAAYYPDLEFLEMTNIAENIIQYCPDLEYLVDYNGNNVLHILMERMDTGIEEPFISKLVKKFALEEVLNQPNNYGNTPLHLATLRRKKRFVHFLAKDSRVDKKARNKNNLTAYDIACTERDRCLKEKDKKSRRAWEYIMSNVNPYDQYFLCDKPPLWIETPRLDVHRVAPEDEKDAKNHVVRVKLVKYCEDHEEVASDALMAFLITVVALVFGFLMPVHNESGVGAAFVAFVISDAMVLSCTVLAILLRSIAGFFDDYNPAKFRTIAASQFLLRFAAIPMFFVVTSGMLVLVLRTHSFWVAIATLLVCVSVFFLAFGWSWLSDRMEED